ncbi:hypothetical protein GCM10023175_54850 [Pseudonocardia xishanensis]|uniref:Uncharacterized protein n=1 Tax=Pseudonocardia xishanensis TaxID=630995 RepID=A0ABP8S014_9PSEU
MVEGVVGNGDRQPVAPRVVRQAAGDGPGAQHPALLEPQVEVRAGTTVVVQDERGPGHGFSVPVPL